jgi:UDP-N-acetyl-D-mannosaminuronic acid dehydrogenase
MSTHIQLLSAPVGRAEREHNQNSKDIGMDKVCILGLGYIGLPTAAMFATHGLNVTGVDINPLIIETLQRGETHLYEPGLGELVQQAVATGRLTVNSHPETADAFIIAVPTPFFSNKSADMRAVIQAAESILPYLKKGNLVVLESTSPPRTTVDLLLPILEKSSLKAGSDFHLAYSPERVWPGQILRELVENSRVIGGIDLASAKLGKELYTHFVKGEIILTDATTAELVKLMENTFRDVNIAIANEFSRLAERFQSDVWEIIRIANRHPRVRILNPGPGVGGHCISVDPWFLVEAAPDISRLVLAARQVNDGQPAYVVSWIEKHLGNLDGRRLAVLGLSYKADVDDLRESPAVETAQLLARQGAQVRAFEPYKPEEQFSGIQTFTSLDETLAGCEAVILLVQHTQFCSLDPASVAQQFPGRQAFDAVGGWEPSAWAAQGFQFHRLGQVG